MCAEVNIPTWKLANVRIHVERVIGLVRSKYMILQGIVATDYLKTESNEGSLITNCRCVCCFTQLTDIEFCKENF